MQIKLMVKNNKYRMTKYVLVLNNHPFSLNFGLANIYDFSVLAIPKKNKQMKIK